MDKPDIAELLALAPAEKCRRFDAMCSATFSHVDGRDLLDELHPRKQIDIKRRVDGVETWFEGDWLSSLMEARNGPRAVLGHSTKPPGPDAYEAQTVASLTRPFADTVAARAAVDPEFRAALQEEERAERESSTS